MNFQNNPTKNTRSRRKLDKVNSAQVRIQALDTDNAERQAKLGLGQDLSNFQKDCGALKNHRSMC